VAKPGFDSAGPFPLHLISCSAKEGPGFQRETLFTNTEITVVGTGYPHASRLKNLEAFLNARHVAVVGRGLIEDPVDGWLRQEGRLKRQVVLNVPRYVQALQAVAQSDLVAFAPKRLADLWQDHRH
jgi:DNA-binding transcriptional LysR family regulator